MQTTVAQRGGQVFSHIRLIKDISTGKKLGYLKIDIDIAVMREILALSETTNPSAQVLLVADDGHVIYDNAGDLTGQQIVDLGLAAGHAQRRLLWRGNAYLYAGQSSGHTH